MLKILVDATQATARLAAIRASLQSELARGLQVQGDGLLARVQANLSGQVLQIRSGALLGSIKAQGDAQAGKITASVGSDGSVPYARIQEYGGRITAHNRMIALPERSYLRSALAEKRSGAVDAIRKLVGEAIS
ncbi:MAG TPA: hypothetical protein VGF97_15725 [Rhizomicrobium sp.]